MSIEKIQIEEKATYISLVVTKFDLENYAKDLSLAPDGTYLGIANMLRVTRNIFVPLHNLYDILKQGSIRDDKNFTQQTRALRKQLNFFSHVRNKSVGHIDRTLAKRAAQWAYAAFSENAKSDSQYQTFAIYEALLEASINSYVGKDGHPKLFNLPMILSFDEDAAEFFDHLEDVVDESINWLDQAIKIVEPTIKFSDAGYSNELAGLAAQTNFDLKSESDSKYVPVDHEAAKREFIESLKEAGVEKRLIRMAEKNL